MLNQLQNKGCRNVVLYKYMIVYNKMPVLVFESITLK